MESARTRIKMTKLSEMERKILSMSRIYKCITFDRLAVLLELSPEMVETEITRMISASLLNGTIDQIDRLITFEGNFLK